MASLAEIAEGYREAAALLQIGLADARTRLKAPDRADCAGLRREIALMEGMLREVREVGDLARHYYEGAYWRNRRFTL